MSDPQSKNKKRVWNFFCFFSPPREPPRGQYPLDCLLPFSGSISPPLSLALSFSLSLPSRTKSARECSDERTQTPPLPWFFRRAHVSRRERERDKERRENEFSVTRSLSRYRLSLPLSPSTFSSEEERKHKKNKQIRKPKTNDTRVPWRRCGS